MKFSITIRKMDKTLTMVVGNEVNPKNITADDLDNVSNTEVYIERLTGLRFHINLIEE